MSTGGGIPSVSTTAITGSRWAVVITREGGFTSFEVGPRTRAEALAAEIREALVRAYLLGLGDEQAPHA